MKRIWVRLVGFVGSVAAFFHYEEPKGRGEASREAESWRMRSTFSG